MPYEPDCNILIFQFLVGQMMIRHVISDYLARFIEAAARHDRMLPLALLEDFKHHISKSPPSPFDICDELERIIATSRWEGGQLLIIAASSNPSLEYVPYLCSILDSSVLNGMHEGAIELLSDLNDARSVPSLIRAVDYSWDWDGDLLVPEKALRALAKIGNKEATSFIRAATISSNERIREIAQRIVE